jgi:8-oxo-dGTP diphosphatase
MEGVSEDMRAAGGAVWQRRPGGRVEVVLVHRPGWDDWSLPKGKLEPGEDDLSCALREVEEETGVAVRPGPELPTIRYLDRDRRNKVVRYWAMEPVSVRPRTPDDEIDELRWLSLPDARATVTYESDREVLDALEEMLTEGRKGSQG